MNYHKLIQMQTKAIKEDFGSVHYKPDEQTGPVYEKNYKHSHDSKKINKEFSKFLTDTSPSTSSRKTTRREDSMPYAYLTQCRCFTCTPCVLLKKMNPQKYQSQSTYLHNKFKFFSSILNYYMYIHDRKAWPWMGS